MMKITTQFHALAEHGQRRLLPVLVVAVLLFGVSACTEPPYTNVDNAQLQAMLEQNIPLYDIRRADEWRQTGVIDGSKLLTFADANGRVKPDFLDRLTATVGKHDPLILICHTGSRTSTLARYLVENMGYTQVFNVRHGISHWIRDDNPIKRI